MSQHKQSKILLGTISARIQGMRRCFQIIKKYRSFAQKHITPSLSEFYSTEQKKWTGTRIRKWPEFAYCIERIKTYYSESKTPIHIVELGCGDGRFAQSLDEELDPGTYTYVGVDASSGLINYAKSRTYNHPTHFIIGDMGAYLKTLDESSIDIIISIASIQHLHRTIRQPLRNEVYRVLKYEGFHISINWSWSGRMITKHRPSILAHIVLLIINHRTFSRGDLMIPFTTIQQSQHINMRGNHATLGKKRGIDNQNHWIYFRFYHLFRLQTLCHMAQYAGLVVPEKGYMNNNGRIDQTRYKSKNSIILASKSVYIESS
ncbi:MAG TPA: class I SAM-dependent methyltransferase [Candidatus Absconditabacterales bacterium]|nr:class I SAM-dependent methyltransferase [Candidatus Absconditabacterales bacterium]HNG97473.1 class I SAM-dependent methyltransferase [Candidatus Absconditabacterales bacterium]